jgi:hypothetical protein
MLHQQHNRYTTRCFETYSKEQASVSLIRSLRITAKDGTRLRPGQRIASIQRMDCDCKNAIDDSGSPNPDDDMQGCSIKCPWGLDVFVLAARAVWLDWLIGSGTASTLGHTICTVMLHGQQSRPGKPSRCARHPGQGKNMMEFNGPRTYQSTDRQNPPAKQGQPGGQGGSLLGRQRRLWLVSRSMMLYGQGCSTNPRPRQFQPQQVCSLCCSSKCRCGKCSASGFRSSSSIET